MIKLPSDLASKLLTGLLNRIDTVGSIKSKEKQRKILLRIVTPVLLLI